MRREFYDGYVDQRTSDKFFNATSFLKRASELSGKDVRIADFLDNKNTKEFLNTLEMDLLQNNANQRGFKHIAYEIKRGRNGATWMHPYLFVKFAMWLSPAFELKIIKWTYDNLVEFRLLAGDHYKEMCDAAASRYWDYYRKAAGPEIFIGEAHILNQLVFGNPSGNQRNMATEAQLYLMNSLQKANIKMIREGLKRSQRERNLRALKYLIS